METPDATGNDQTPSLLKRVMVNIIKFDFKQHATCDVDLIEPIHPNLENPFGSGISDVLQYFWLVLLYFFSDCCSGKFFEIPHSGASII